MKKPPSWVISDLQRVAKRDIEKLESQDDFFTHSLKELEEKKAEIESQIEAKKDSIEKTKEAIIEARNYLLYLGESW